MPTLLDANSFREHTTQAHVKVLQIIFVALAVGILSFSLIVVAGVFVAKDTPPTEEDIGLMRILTGFVLVIMLSAAVLAGRIRSMLLSRSKLDPILALQHEDDATGQMVEGIHAHLRTSEIVRMAILEASAVFGLVTCVLGLVFGVLPDAALFWVNLVPAIFFLLVVGMTFPSADRLTQLFEEFVTPHLN